MAFLILPKLVFFFLGAKLAGKVPVRPSVTAAFGQDQERRPITKESPEHDVDRGDYDDP